MNDNTILRIKVPANLYESVKKQLTLNEAKKSGHNYGAGMEVVKEKKMQTHKDGMKKVEEMKDSKKPHSLEELKAVKEKLEKKINEMESGNKNIKDGVNEYYGVDPKLDILTLALGVGLPIATAAAALVKQVGFKGALDLIKKSNAPEKKKAEIEKAVNNIKQ